MIRVASPDELAGLRAFLAERVQVRGPDECWPWTGYINPTHGYGQATIGPRGAIVRWRAHRLAYFVHHGRIETTLLVMHSCDYRPCCNPKHLSQGTALANNQDMMKKGRFVHPAAIKRHCAHGHPFNEANTYYKGEHRQCRPCRRVQQARYRAHKKEDTP